MFIAVIMWASIVSGLTIITNTYQKCKNKECSVVIKEIGYEIKVKEKAEN